MFLNEFDERVQADLDVALRRACERLGADKELHDARQFVAERLMACARAGQTTLGELTAAGLRAVAAYRADRANLGE